jgi:hypothetical protein
VSPTFQDGGLRFNFREILAYYFVSIAYVEHNMGQDPWYSLATGVLSHDEFTFTRKSIIRFPSFFLTFPTLFTLVALGD